MVNYAWGTWNELKYLDNLQPTEFQLLRGVTRDDLLVAYEKGLKHRRTWGKINKIDVINYLDDING